VTGFDPNGRFSSRVDDHIRYRPSYPRKVVERLARECALSAESVVADIGSGTGFLAKLFLDAGCSVIGVERTEQGDARGRRAGSGRLSEARQP
jgi:hypothetical protein